MTQARTADFPKLRDLPGLGSSSCLRRAVHGQERLAGVDRERRRLCGDGDDVVNVAVPNRAERFGVVARRVVSSDYMSMSRQRTRPNRLTSRRARRLLKSVWFSRDSTQIRESE